MGIADHAGRPLTAEEEILIDLTLGEVRTMLQKSIAKHAPMYSPHEGMSVIREEVDELWEHVKMDTGRLPEAGKEALQIAAMGVRYVIDLVYKEKGE